MRVKFQEMLYRSAVFVVAWVACPSIRAQGLEAAYDGFVWPNYGYSSTDPATSYGALLTLTQTGTLGRVGFSLYNHAASGGNIVAGKMNLTVYDAANGYSGGPVNLPVLGTVAVSLDLGSHPLVPGYWNVYSSGDLTAMNIVLPTKVLITQQFDLTQGSSSRYGFVASSTGPIVGSSSGKYFLSNSMNPPGFYSSSGGGNAFPLYQVSVTPVPEPEGAALLCGLGLLGWITWRRYGPSSS